MDDERKAVTIIEKEDAHIISSGILRVRLSQEQIAALARGESVIFVTDDRSFHVYLLLKV